MSKGKARLMELHGRISENQKSEKQNIESKTLEANRPHGEKSDHVKVSVTMPPEIYEGLMAEVMRRKVAKTGNAQLSAVMREAAVGFLQGS